MVEPSGRHMHRARPEAQVAFCCYLQTGEASWAAQGSGARQPPPSRAPAAEPTSGHLQMNPRAVLEATAQVPPFLHGFPLQPLTTDSQRRPGGQRDGHEGLALPPQGPARPSPPHLSTYRCGRHDTRSGSH